MITPIKKTYLNDSYVVDFRGLSTETKPTEWDNYNVSNGSTYYEIDTGDLYVYDEDGEQWVAQ